MAKKSKTPVEQRDDTERRFNAMWNVMSKYHANDLKAEMDASAVEPSDDV